jgi:hypothetical protein
VERDPATERMRYYVDTLCSTELFEGMVIAGKHLATYVVEDGTLYPVEPELLDVIFAFADSAVAHGESPDTPREFLILELARAVREAQRTGCHLWVWQSTPGEIGVDGPRWEGAEGHEKHVKSMVLALGNLLCESLSTLAA